MTERSSASIALDNRKEHFMNLVKDILKDPDRSNIFYDNNLDEIVDIINRALELYTDLLVLELLDEGDRRFLNEQ